LSGGEKQSKGLRPHLAGFLTGLGVPLACFGVLALADGGGGGSLLLVACSIAVGSLLGLLNGWLWEPERSGVVPRAGLLLGMALAAALADRLPAEVGVVPVAGTGFLLMGAGAWAGRALTPKPIEGSLLALAPYGLLTGAVIAAAVSLVIAYLPAARSLPYAAADLATAFFLGALATLWLWRRAARLPGAPMAAALAVVAVCMVVAFSFYGYPALVVSGSAVLQTSAYLLTPGRVFPFWLLAFGLGIPAGLLFCSQTPRIGFRGTMAAAWTSAALVGLLARWSYAGPYAVAVGLALLAAGIACVSQWRAGVRGSLVLRVVTIGAGSLGLAWLAVGDPHMEWAGLRMTLGDILHRTGPVGEAAPAGQPVSADRTPAGWHVVLADGDVRAEFLDGNLIDLRQPGAQDQQRAVRACVALGLAYAPADGKVALVEPALDVSRRTLRVLAPARAAEERALGAYPKGGYSLILCGPGLLTEPRDVLALISKEGLEREQERLAPDGVLALWLPAGNLHVDDLRRALATVGAVFPHYDVYLEGRQAVVIAGGSGQVSYARLARLFGAPPQGEADRMLADAGFTDPMDLLVGFVGGAEDLAGLTAGVRPWSVWRPARPPAMALDLAEPARPAAVLALAQYRMLGAGRLLDRLQFESPAQKMVALRGFGPIYADRTGRTLGGLGLSGAERRGELLRFLTSPLARLDLLAPQQKEQEVRIAVALSALGLRDVAAGVLKDAIKAGKDDFEVNVELAGILEAQADRAEALKHFRRAIELQPDSVPVRGRMVDLLLSMGQDAEAADVLKEIVQRQPGSVAALLELGYLSARLKRYDEAADAAQRVLRIAPNNADAQALLTLSHPAAAGQTQPPARPSQPPAR
jgi:tetratricopeptide (TPR) repeat protein